MKKTLTLKYSEREKDFIAFTNFDGYEGPNMSFILGVFCNEIDIYPYLISENLEQRKIKLFKELEKRGYDPKTLKFSIEKKNA